MYLSIYLSTYLPTYLSIYLSVCLSVYLPVYLQAWKRSYSARRPQVLNLTTSKTQQFCETSSMFELDNVKDEAILRDFVIFQMLTTSKTKQFCELPQYFNLTTSKTKQFCETSSFFLSWQHQKRKNSARLPSRMESCVQSWRPRTNAFCNFSSPSV